MRLDLWSVVAVMLGLGLLLSALKDLMTNLESFALRKSNIESVADLD